MPGDCRFGPVLILLDDLHHFDIASWQLLLMLCSDSLDGCVIVTTMRDHEGVLGTHRCMTDDRIHLHNKVMDCVDALVDLPSTKQLSIEGFTHQEVRQMVSAMLPMATIHESNVEAIQTQTNGHPVHVEQIALYIDSLGTGALAALALPRGLLTSNLCNLAATSMTHIILARVDWLRPAQQLTLKVCSVLGPHVSLDLLVQTYPLVADDQQELCKQLLDDMDHLVGANFLEESSEPQRSWGWHSTVARDVVYEVIPFNQRRLLHARLASALESMLASVPDFVPRSHIAYHWTKSCTSVEAVEWQNTMNAINTWKLAAKEMDGKGAHLDAVRLMTKSLGLTRALLVAEMQGGGQIDGNQNDPLITVSTLEAARQYKFIADMYYNLATADEVCLLR
jgi:predicted ATPase